MNQAPSTIFIGDAHSDGLELYAIQNGLLLQSAFLTKNGYSVRSASMEENSSLQPLFAGERRSPMHTALLREADRVFIQLGLHDLGRALVEIADDYRALLERVKGANPKARLYVQSVFPVLAGKEIGLVNNRRIAQLNGMLQALCLDLDAVYIPVGEALMDASGGLNPRYCADGHLHLNEAGYARWVEALKEYMSA